MVAATSAVATPITAITCKVVGAMEKKTFIRAVM